MTTTPWAHLHHKAEDDKPVRFEIWRQFLRTEDRPWRRKHDRKYGFKAIHIKGWSAILSYALHHPRLAMRVNTWYDRHDRCRRVQVFFGTRVFLREHFTR